MMNDEYWLQCATLDPGLPARNSDNDANDGEHGPAAQTTPAASTSSSSAAWGANNAQLDWQYWHAAAIRQANNAQPVATSSQLAVANDDRPAVAHPSAIACQVAVEANLPSHLVNHIVTNGRVMNGGRILQPGHPHYDYVENVVKKHGGTSFRHILKSHMERSNKLGGAICKKDGRSLHVADASSHEQTPDGRLRVTVAFPNSFEPNDGKACSASVVGPMTGESDNLVEDACRLLVMELLFLDALHNHPTSKMVLKQCNWHVQVQELLNTIHSASVEFIPQPHTSNHHRRTQQAHGYEAPADPVAREHEVRRLLFAIATNEANNEAPTMQGWANVGSLKKLQWDGVQIAPWKILDRLIIKGTCLMEVQKYPETFEVFHEIKRWCFRLRQPVEEPVVPPTQPTVEEPVAHPMQPVEEPVVPPTQPMARPIQVVVAPPMQPVEQHHNFASEHCRRLSDDRQLDARRVTREMRDSIVPAPPPGLAPCAGTIIGSFLAKAPPKASLPKKAPPPKAPQLETSSSDSSPRTFKAPPQARPKPPPKAPAKALQGTPNANAGPPIIPNAKEGPPIRPPSAPMPEDLTTLMPHYHGPYPIDLPLNRHRLQPGAQIYTCAAALAALHSFGWQTNADGTITHPPQAPTPSSNSSWQWNDDDWAGHSWRGWRGR